MDSGAEDRSRLRLHVRAAREWLGRADESLGRADDVRGDLHLMLAQAELARAKETERPGVSVVWARRLAPLFVAALIAGGGYTMWRTGTRVAPMPVPPVQRTEQSVTRLPEVVPAVPMPQEAEKTVLPEIVEAPVPEEAPEIVPAMEPEVPETGETAETPQETVQQARLPSEDMQRLMNSAGQSLRAIQ